MRYVNDRNGLFANEGYGGGVFNYNVAFGSVDNPTPVGGLGAKIVGIGQAVGDDPQYPWLEFSQQTQVLQDSINEIITGKGLCPITVDGKIGPRTCGALDAAQPSPLDFNQTCENRRSEVAFVSPVTEPCPEPELPPYLPPEEDLPEYQPPPQETAPEEEEVVEEVETKTGNTGILIVSGLLLAAAAGVAVLGSKKR